MGPDLDFDVPENFNMASILVDRHVEEGRGGRIAIYYRDEAITYQELQRRVNKAGNMLGDAGIEIEDRVILLTTDRPEFIETYVGAMKIGAVPVPVLPNSTPDQLAYYINDSRAAALVVDEEFAERLWVHGGTFRYLKRVFIIPSEGSDGAFSAAKAVLGPKGDVLSYRTAFAAAGAELETEPTSRDDPSYWLYSSGTTGQPKGTVHLHQDMVYCTRTWLKHVSKPTERDINYSVSKLPFSYGLVNSLYQPLMAGIGVVLVRDAPNAEVVLRTVHRYRPTIVFSTPAIYKQILLEHEEGRLDTGDLSSVRMWVSAGEALPEIIYERWRETFGFELLDGIGSTEFGYIYIQSLPGRVRPGFTGQVLPGYGAKILDADENPVADGEVGALYMQSESFAAYYWKKRERTRDTFRGRWMKTGDLYSRDADGYYHYEGREDDTFKVSGQWVSPVEVENVLLSHEAIADAAVVACVDVEDGLVKPKAHVVLKPGYKPSFELVNELKEHAKKGLAPHYYKYPRFIDFETELPKTGTGKIQRYKLRQQQQEVER